MPCHAAWMRSFRPMQRALLRARGLLGPDATGATQSITALAVSSLTAVFAGIALASVTGTFERLPGLLVLVPAAIGMRGNISGALGSRSSTAIHSGLFVLSRRTDSIVAQNVLAALTLSSVMSTFLAPVAWLVAALFGLGDTVSIADLLVVSVTGGFLASIVVLVVSLTLANQAANRGWDLDNVNAPIISAVGDLVALPALVIATGLAQHGRWTNTLAVVVAAIALAAGGVAVRSSLPVLRTVVRESLPILAVAGCVLAVAGVAIEGEFERLSNTPALLILVPAALSSAGSLGGILSSQLASKLHLGLVEPGSWPDSRARHDMVVTLLISVPIFALNGVLAEIGAQVFSLASPGLATMVGVSLAGGIAASLVVVVIAYYGTVVAVRIGVDPDTYGIPVVTSVVDLVGAYALVAAIVVLGAG
jgi:mgtE-like transporter